MIYLASARRVCSDHARRALRPVTRAELAVHVATPAVDVPVAAEAAGVLAAGGQGRERYRRGNRYRGRRAAARQVPPAVDGARGIERAGLRVAGTHAVQWHAVPDENRSAAVRLRSVAELALAT